MLNDLKDLERAIKLCRKLGVQSIKIGDVEFHLGEVPQQAGSRADKGDKQVTTSLPAAAKGEITEHTKIEVEGGELTDEQLLYYSAEPLFNAQ